MKTKEKILLAALDVLMEGGFQAFTQTRVAERAGIRQGLLTYHYPKKYDLLKAVVEESKNRISRLVEEIPRDELTLEKFEEVVTGVSLSKTFPRLMLALSAAAEDEPTINQWFVENDQRYKADMASLLNSIGINVSDEDISFFRSALMGASLIHIQQNTDASAQTARYVIHLALQTLVNKYKTEPETSSQSECVA